jgi:hypothetical protein
VAPATVAAGATEVAEVVNGAGAGLDGGVDGPVGDLLAVAHVHGSTTEPGVACPLADRLPIHRYSLAWVAVHFLRGILGIANFKVKVRLTRGRPMPTAVGHAQGGGTGMLGARHQDTHVSG